MCGLISIALFIAFCINAFRGNPDVSVLIASGIFSAADAGYTIAARLKNKN